MAQARVVDTRKVSDRELAGGDATLFLMEPVEKVLACSTTNIAVVAVAEKRGESVMPAVETELIRFAAMHAGTYELGELDDLIGRLERISDSGLSAAVIHTLRDCAKGVSAGGG